MRKEPQGIIKSLLFETKKEMENDISISKKVTELGQILKAEIKQLCDKERTERANESESHLKECSLRTVTRTK